MKWRSRCWHISWTIGRSSLEIIGTRMQAVELVSLVSSSSKTRYLVRRLRAALPDLRIAVGRWAPSALADESSQTLLDAGANHVATSLIESRDYLGGLLEMPRLSDGDVAAAGRLTALPLPLPPAHDKA